MSWWQVTVMAGAIVFAGLYVGNSVGTSVLALEFAIAEIVKCLESLGLSVATICGVINVEGTEMFEQLNEASERWKSLDRSAINAAESLASVSEAVKTFLGKLNDPDAMANSVKAIRNGVRQKDEAEQSRAVWEQERQRQHDAWNRAAREEVDKIASRESKKGETK
jgi:hypothetical protein